MSRTPALHTETPVLPFSAPVQRVLGLADIIGRSLAVAVAVFGVCILAQWLIYGKVLDQDGIRYITPAIAGIITGAATLRMLLMERAQALALAERFQAIAQAHHHIRNALQSLSYQRYFTEDKVAASRLLDAVNRIQWVLDEVFPRLQAGAMKGVPHDSSSSHRRHQ